MLIDYIVRPISIEDLVLATNKAMKSIQERLFFEAQFKKNIFIESSKQSNYVTISSMDKADILKDEIIFCKSDVRYTTFFLKKTKGLSLVKI